MGIFKLKYLSAILLALAFASVSNATAVTLGAKSMRCSHQLPPDNHIAKVIDQWAAEIEMLTNNRIDVQINGANSLVDAPRNAMAVRAGEIECAFSINSQWADSLPLMAVTLEPFALHNVDTLKRWDGSPAAELLNDEIAELGITNLVWLFTTWQTAITSKGDFLIAPEDFKGVRIQGLGPHSNAAFEALGAIPVDMSDADAVKALKAGDLDAGLTNISSALSSNFYAVQDHITILPLFAVYYNGYINSEWLATLPSEYQKAIEEASRKATLWAIEASEIAAAAVPRLLKEEGVNIHLATAKEIAALQDIMRPAFNQVFLDRTGDKGKTLLQLMNDLELEMP
ncbi:TRAP transporter substrate-binding protein DctP [Sneathiella sp.]|uniref:TRAP transporter substrate-binding protein DctP n=1 Tax=Sneathiella sp. TaxID=1964365 RepID=UPI002FE2B961